MATAIATDAALKAPLEANTTIIKSKLSIIPISFENLVKILPIGFESKKTILDLRVLCVALLSILFPPPMIMTKIIMTLNKFMTKYAAIRIMNMLGYLFYFCSSAVASVQKLSQ